MEKTRYEIIEKFSSAHWWYQDRQVLLKQVLDSLHFPNKIHLLDYGCGNGYMFDLLTRYGNVVGADTEPRALKFSRKKKYAQLQRIIPNQPLPFSANTFDCIICLDVLEHIDGDLQLLQELLRILKLGGFLIIFAPAFPILWSDLDNQSHHLRRYARGELSSKLISANFSIMRLTYFNYFFFLPILTVRILQKFIPKNTNSWGVNPIVKSNFINNILKSIFIFDIKSLKLFSPPFGVSLLSVAQKRDPKSNFPAKQKT